MMVYATMWRDRGGVRMKKWIAAGVMAVTVGGFFILAATAQAPADSSSPRFGADNELMRPDNYREWIYLSSGLGMSYAASPSNNPNPSFDNVFVAPAAYRSFLQTGTWPEKTVFVLE